jgi:predicted metalloprotease with PDZ domain
MFISRPAVQAGLCVGDVIIAIDGKLPVPYLARNTILGKTPIR